MHRWSTSKSTEVKRDSYWPHRALRQDPSTMLYMPLGNECCWGTYCIDSWKLLRHLNHECHEDRLPVTGRGKKLLYGDSLFTGSFLFFLLHFCNLFHGVIVSSKPSQTLREKKIMISFQRKFHTTKSSVTSKSLQSEQGENEWRLTMLHTWRSPYYGPCHCSMKGRNMTLFLLYVPEHTRASNSFAVTYIVQFQKLVIGQCLYIRVDK